MKKNSRGVKLKYQDSVLINMAITFVTLLIAALLCEGLYRLGLGEQNISIVMVLAVFVISAATHGYWYGLAATVIGVFVYDFLVTKPRFGFSFTLGFPITFSIMLLVALVTCTITARIKQDAEIAQEKEQHAELLYDINRKLLSSRDESTIARYAMDYLKNDLLSSVVLFTSFSDSGPPSVYFRKAEGDVNQDFFTNPAEQAAVLLAAKLKKSVGADGVYSEGSSSFYYPIIAHDELYGVFGFSYKNCPISKSKMPFITLIANQTAHALRVQTLTRQQQEATILAETEKARSSFLRSISHDLRTPLTSIIGASSTFLENESQLPHSTKIQLVKGVHSDAQWLLSMVENILSVTKIRQDGMLIKKKEEVAEEIVGEAVGVFRKRYPHAKISVIAPGKLLLVKMDALLITQVINNLLDNAQRHAGSDDTKISVVIEEKDDFAVFSVTDNGPGINRELLPDLFSFSSEHSEDNARGLGIGLSICKSIVKAHGGWIKAANNGEKGAVFTFGLPLEKEL